MPIPTKFDHDLADVENAAAGILLRLRTMQHAAAADLPRMRMVLRDQLQDYVNHVMELADE